MRADRMNVDRGAASRGPGRFWVSCVAAIALGVAAPAAHAEPELSIREGGNPFAEVSAAMQDGFEWPESLPAPDAVFERHVEACGGLEAIESTSSRYITGNIRNNEANYRAGLRIYQDNQDRIWMELRQPGQGKNVLVFDGEAGWGIGPHGDARGLVGGVLRDLQLSADFAGDADWRSRYTFLETVDFIVIANEPCVRLFYRAQNGKEGMHAFSLRDGKMRGTQTFSGSTEGEVAMTTVYVSYEDVNGYQLPSVMEQITQNSKTRIEYRKIETDREPPVEDPFERPESIQEQFLRDREGRE